jgi:hypothetical protein
MVSELEGLFPGLARGGCQITSPRSPRYNCIAWAAGETGAWWWPGPNPEEEFWPPGVNRVATLDSFREAFATLGYLPCEGEDLEADFEKVAIFANAQGVPTHGARQLSNGRWTSKLGKREDIEHALRDLEGTLYGAVVLIMKRSSPPEELDEH